MGRSRSIHWRPGIGAYFLGAALLVAGCGSSTGQEERDRQARARSILHDAFFPAYLEAGSKAPLFSRPVCPEGTLAVHREYASTPETEPHDLARHRQPVETGSQGGQCAVRDVTGDAHACGGSSNQRSRGLLSSRTAGATPPPTQPEPRRVTVQTWSCMDEQGKPHGSFLKRIGEGAEASSGGSYSRGRLLTPVRVWRRPS